jgi:hypothetical protein
VFEEKEPDIRLRGAAGSSLAIEVKIPEKNWTVADLDNALTEQLCGKYLRAGGARHGILLLVHQKAKRWREPGTQKMLTFDAVVERLEALAAKISGQAPDAPQPVIGTLDVSTLLADKSAQPPPVGKTLRPKPRRARARVRSRS